MLIKIACSIHRKREINSYKLEELVFGYMNPKRSRGQFLLQNVLCECHSFNLSIHYGVVIR